jgi:hypothetical protein
LQHQGEYLLALVRHYDKGGPKITKGEEGVFFNTVGHHLVVYPASQSRLFAIIAGVILLLALGIGFYTRSLRFGGLLGSMLLILFAIVLTASVGGGLQWVSYKLFYVYIMYNAAYYHIAFMLLGVSVTAALFAVFRNRLSPENLYAAVLFLQVPVLVRLEWGLPLASYSVTWPLLFGAVGLGVACLLRRAGLPAGAGVLVQTASALPAIFFLVPGMHAFYHFGGSISPAGNAALFLLLLFSLAPAVWLVLGGAGKRVAQAALILALVVFFAGWAAQRYTPEKPKMNSVSYALNLDTNTAVWVTTDKEPDEWVRQFVPADKAVVGSYEATLPNKKETYAHAPAPLAPLKQSTLTAIEDTTAEGRRNIALKYTRARDTCEVRFELVSPHKVLVASVDGAGEVVADMTGWHLNVGYPPHDDTMVLRLTIDASVAEPVRIRMMEDTFTLPELTTLGYRPRPEWMIPKPNTLDWWEDNHQESHHTYVTKTFSF